MPYYIGQHPDCNGEWSVVKDDGTLLACHTSKDNAIAQMVAVSLSENLEPAGEYQGEYRSDENRAIDLTPPAYMRAAARQGLRYYEEGKAGDGLVERTVREARAMAAGSVTADKWVRIRAWIARHLVDLESPNANPNSDNYPSAGVVAHLLWGSGPSLRGAQRALKYAEGIVTRLEEENRNKYVEGEAMAKFEVRTTPANFEIREDDTGMYFEGYAAVFDSPSEPLPFIERIARGAFRNSLKKSRNDIKLLWNHDTSLVLGSTRAKTLTLIEDERGLKVSAQLPNTSAGRDAKELLARGDVDSMSFGFSVPSGGDVWNSEGTERTLKSVRLHEVSIVAFPAYSGTAGTTSVRGLDLVAERSLVDADELQDAIVMMEAGGTLTTEAANILRRVIDTLEVEDEPMEDMEDQLPEDMPEESTDAVVSVEETNDGDFSALELVKAKLWLLERK